MLCPNCGTNVGDAVRLCDNCAAEKQKREEAASPKEAKAEPEESAAAFSAASSAASSGTSSGAVKVAGYLPANGYAGFWYRAAAYLFDASLIATAARLVYLAGGEMLHDLTAILGGLAYFAYFESSARGATPGKLLVGARVLTVSGERVSVLRAAGRHISKIVSILTFGIGFVIAGFTEKKQALHDFIASTIVVRTEKASAVKAVGAFAASLILMVILASIPRQRPTGTVPPIDQLQLSSQPGGQPVTPPGVTPAPPGQILGTLAVNDNVTNLNAGYTLYNPFLRVVEVGFYREPLPAAVATTLTEKNSLAELEPPPDVLAALTFAPGGADCSLSSLSDYRVAIAQSLTGTPASNTFTPARDAPEIQALSCTLAPDGPVSLRLAHQGIPSEAGGLPLISWDLHYSGNLTARLRDSFSFNSSSAKRQLALWDGARNTLTAAFFSDELTPEEMLRIRTERDLLAVKEKQPVAAVELVLAGDVAQKLSIESVKKYGVTFYGSPKNYSVPRMKDAYSFYFGGPGAPSPKLSGMEGGLSEGDLVRAHLVDSMQESIGPAVFTFNWDLQIAAPVLDLEAKIQAGPEEDDTASSARGVRVKADGQGAEFKTAFALFYPDESDLAVGFYADELTPDEENAIAANKVLSVAVNNKRPAMILFLDFKRGTTTVSPKDLAAYTAYFYRDFGSGFAFGGPFDQDNVKRLALDFTPDEVKRLHGELKDGKLVDIRLKGEHAAKQSRTKFGWDVNVEVPVRVVR